MNRVARILLLIGALGFPGCVFYLQFLHSSGFFSSPGLKLSYVFCLHFGIGTMASFFVALMAVNEKEGLLFYLKAMVCAMTCLIGAIISVYFMLP